MVVREMTGHTAEETIDKLSSIFAELGLPRTLHCDRGTNYTSSKFQDFCKKLEYQGHIQLLQNIIAQTMLKGGFKQLNSS